MALRHSQIRKIILDEHRVLLERLTELEGLVSRFQKHEAVEHQLPRLLSGFFEALLQHIEREELILRPVLAEVDAWGPGRIRKLDAEHQEQREVIQHLRSLAPSSPGYGAEVSAFLANLRHDMAAEEKDCLADSVLRDDVIVLDSFGG